MSIAPIDRSGETIALPPAHPVTPVAEVVRVAPSTLKAPGNLSAAAAPVYQALQAASSLPPSVSPSFILPANGNALRLYAAVQAIATERIYPAPVFSFRA